MVGLPKTACSNNNYLFKKKLFLRHIYRTPTEIYIISVTDLYDYSYTDDDMRVCVAIQDSWQEVIIGEKVTFRILDPCTR